MTTEIKALIRQKHKVQLKYSKSPVTYGSEFRAIRNRVKSAIRSAKSQPSINKGLRKDAVMAKKRGIQ